MRIYTKESLENLRRRIDLIEVLESHLPLKKAGAAYKTLCPFHDEKTPSFMIQKGDTHYHCFGCGAHGDSIQFMMNHLKMSFHDAVDALAHKFNVHMEFVESMDEQKGPSRASLKDALHKASHFFHFLLLHTPQGHEALQYLYSRGLDLDFIRLFTIGFAPKHPSLFRTIMHRQGVNDELLIAAGLLGQREGRGHYDFFADRIMFPIHDPVGAVIGFSGRKYKEETFGGKYVNTPETTLFKKSRILFGLNHSRRRIIKEKRAIIVEGQVDALRLIQAGLNLTVAGQGTAFGEGHVKELASLGVNTVYLALDGDLAGREAALKIGHFFQKEAIEAHVVQMPDGMDPDSILVKQGISGFISLLENSVDYLTFAFQEMCKQYDIHTPVGKNEVISQLVKQIRSWEHALIIHESLRLLAHLAKVPEEMVGVGHNYLPNLHIRKSANIGLQTVDPDLIAESDFLRWILIQDDSYFKIGIVNVQPNHLISPPCREIYQTIIEKKQDNKPLEFLSLSIDISDLEARKLLSEILEKKVNRDKAKECFVESIKKLLERNWMQQLEQVKTKIQGGQCSEDEVMVLAKQFDTLRRNPPVVDVTP